MLIVMHTIHIVPNRFCYPQVFQSSDLFHYSRSKMQLKVITNIGFPKIDICCRMAEIQMEDTKAIETTEVYQTNIKDIIT